MKPVIHHPFVPRDDLMDAEWAGGCENWSPREEIKTKDGTLWFRSQCGWLDEYHTQEGVVANRDGEVGVVKTDENGVHEASCAKCTQRYSSSVDGKAAKMLMEHNAEKHQ